MAAQFYKINYKSDFVLTINSDAGWAVPFCIKFWTGMPSHGYFAGFDGENYVNCRVGETPTQLLVMFDDHHMPVGPLRMQIAYHTTIEEFPDRKFDEVTNPTNVTVDIDGTEYQVMLDFTGETGAEIDFSMPSSGVMSVNGKIGYVTLTAEDVGAQPTIEDLATIRSGAAEGATAVQPAEMTAALATKQDAIPDLANIRSGAAAGATAVQPATLQEGLATKQDTISDLATIRSGAAAGATAVQPAALQEGLATKQNVISDLATIRSGAAAGATAVQPAALTPIENDIDAIEGKIPSAASTSNQLADKAFVNSALADKADTSDIPTALSQLSQDSTHRVVTDAEKSTWNGKQNAIDDLATIRSGAAAGATAVQPAAMNTALAAKQDTLTFDNTPTANSSNPVKSSGIKTALDAKQSTISTVNVTVDNNTGTPSGSASVSGSTLSLSFQNLKGATGATGATGPQGPQGERGLPGESGVTGDVSGFTVIQTIDPSATYGATDIAGAATVQATNAELTELGGEVNGEDYTPTYTASRGNYINASGEKAENSSFSITTPFAVSAGSTVTFVGKANGNMACIAQTDANESSYTVLKVGESNSTTKTYTATVNEDCYIVISYYGLTSISVTTPALSVRIEQNKSNITSLATTVDSVKWLAGGVLTIEPEWNSGAIDLDGNIVAVTGYYYTSPILIENDGLLTFNAKTSGNYTAIALTNSSGSSHTVMVKGLTATSFNDYTLNVEAGQYISLCGYYPYSANPSTQTITITPINDRVRAVEKSVESLDSSITPLNSVVSCYDFNGIDACISFEAISFSSDGDSIEFDVEPNTTPNQYYNFLRNSVNSSHLGVFLSKTGFSVRADDNSYLFTNVAISPSHSRFKFKISYENGNVAVYVDGVKVAETDGVQKPLTVDNLGHTGNTSYNYYWQGRVYSVNVNGGGAIMLDELDGYVSTNAELIYPYGLLTEEQYNMLMSSSSASKCTVIATSSSVNVYFQINGSNYGHAVIEHQTSSEIAQYGYKDLWRLTTCVMSRYENNTFTDTSSTLLVGAENEFAINMQGMGDFTGGYHGFERIDLDGACYVTFIVDGQEYTITELIALGTVNCDTFGYRQKSLYYTGGNLSYQEPFAWHVKTTTFGNKGYNTRNFVLFDFTNAPNVNSMSIITLLKGLVCVHKDCALYVVGNDGTRHEATHPSTTIGDWVTFQSHPTDSRIKMYNGGLSCYLNSVLVGKTTLTGVNENTGFVSIYDRQNDCKYYAYAYTGGTIAVNDGNYIEVECNVEFFKNLLDN